MNSHRKGNIWNGKGIESKGQYGYRTKQGGEYNNVELHSQHNRQLVNCITVVVDVEPSVRIRPQNVIVLSVVMLLEIDPELPHFLP